MVNYHLEFAATQSIYLFFNPENIRGNTFYMSLKNHTYDFNVYDSGSFSS